MTLPSATCVCVFFVALRHTHLLRGIQTLQGSQYITDRGITVKDQSSTNIYDGCGSLGVH